MTEVVSVGRENGHVPVVVSLLKGEWSSYRGGQFNGGRIVMFQRWSLMEGKWAGYRGGQFIGRGMVMLQKLSVKWRENSHLTEVTSLMEGEWSCYRGCH